MQQHTIKQGVELKKTKNLRATRRQETDGAWPDVHIHPRSSSQAHTHTCTRTQKSCGLNFRPGGNIVKANDNVEVEQTG